MVWGLEILRSLGMTWGGGEDRGRKATKRFQYQFLASVEEGLGVSEDRNMEFQKWMKRAQ